ncbi:uncharacterized protein LOC128226649 [Mya arenaria]|uniref:uncharacterized protein LOC128226649 n=1 Tax=Mya arenaria TaxID=6604 RepID=UPI0022E42428|nr:uncharacterized protein LOC128226649 [Mya arenaria]
MASSRNYELESDEVIYQFCEICLLDDQHRPAVTSCETCFDHLCGRCTVTHESNHKDHAILVLPKYNPNIKQITQSNCTTQTLVDKCLISGHEDELLKYLCSDCDALACLTCVCTRHRGCKQVRNIAESIDSVDFQERISRYNDSLHALSTKLSRAAKTIYMQRAGVQKDHASARTIIEKHIMKMRSDVAVNFKVVKDKVEETKNADTETNEFCSLNCHGMKTNINAETNKVENVKGDRQKIQRHIRLLKSKERMSDFRTQLQNVEGHNKFKRYEYQPVVRPKAITSDMLGNLLQIDSLLSLSSNTNTQSTDVDIQQVRKMKLLNNHFLVIIKWEKVACLDIDKMIVIHEKCCKEKVNDVARVASNQIAVTCPRSGYVRIFNVNEDGRLHIDRALLVEKDCHAIEHIETNFVISYGVPTSEVRLYTDTGILVRILNIDDDVCPALRSPLSLAINLDDNSLYIGDAVSDCVVNVTLEGTILNIWKDFANPRDITVSEDGHILVCGGVSNSVLELKPGQIGAYRELVPATDGFLPRSVAYDAKRKKLFVGSRHAGIRIYHME